MHNKHFTVRIFLKALQFTFNKNIIILIIYMQERRNYDGSKEKTA